MSFFADLHIHSKYSRATSKEMEVQTLANWGKIKGIDVIGTGDFTHPLYLKELKEKLTPLGNGLFKLKENPNDISFLLTAEVSNIFSQGGKLRKVHSLIFAPDFDTVDRINAKLDKRGNLSADGRPIFGSFSAKELLEEVLSTSEDCMLVPAHAWTPWFSVFGAKSGFDSLEECFGEMTEYVYAIETGLSSDPAMNWRVSSLDNITLISNSDAHSPAKLGREANILDCEQNYYAIMNSIKTKKDFLGTLEFFPEEGKYHYDGHRDCDILFAPEQSLEHNNICPVCNRNLTIGVMNRVAALADRPVGFVPDNAKQVRHLIPLVEIIAETLGRGVNTKGVQTKYHELLQDGRSEFDVLLNMPMDELVCHTDRKIAAAIYKMREGDINIIPGYDGVFGKINIWNDDKPKAAKKAQPDKQMNLF